jgi:hypothetical protein
METPCAGTGRSRVRLWWREPQAASGSRRTYADDERTGEAGRSHSTREVAEQSRGPHGQVFVRFADDFVAGFEHRHEAERFLAELRERFAQFGLALHPDKTRIVEFGRYAEQNRRGGGGGKPETFNFLDFTHSCAKTRKGWFTVPRQTMRQRWQAKLRALKDELRRRMHTPIPEQGAYLRSVLLGHFRYYGVPLNGPALCAFRMAVARLWQTVLSRCSQGHHLPWRRMKRFIPRWLPTASICHPYPMVRLGVMTQGGSRMR